MRMMIKYLIETVKVAAENILYIKLKMHDFSIIQTDKGLMKIVKLYNA
ncbi:MAG: hypothetical protein HQM10_16785 [Candidatus Riflebacteria bacterium]|nr:hypothetical protein [Candidatus Riflebacteria bacterium]